MVKACMHQGLKLGGVKTPLSPCDIMSNSPLFYKQRCVNLEGESTVYHFDVTWNFLIGTPSRRF